MSAQYSSRHPALGAALRQAWPASCSLVGAVQVEASQLSAWPGLFPSRESGGQPRGPKLVRPRRRPSRCRHTRPIPTNYWALLGWSAGPAACAADRRPGSSCSTSAQLGQKEKECESCAQNARPSMSVTARLHLHLQVQVHYYAPGWEAPFVRQSASQRRTHSSSLTSSRGLQ